MGFSALVSIRYRFFGFPNPPRDHKRASISEKDRKARYLGVVAYHHAPYTDLTLETRSDFLSGCERVGCLGNLGN
jgi:hypothetical protein